MDDVIDALRWDLYVHGGRLRFHIGWMVVNSVLATIPVLLSGVLFRRRRHTGRGPMWALGVVLFALFLPNAPYLLTDLVHLVQDARAVRSERALYVLYVPAYAVVVAYGFVCYALAIARLRRWWHAEGFAAWPAVLGLVHVATSIGVYLGRVERLNSWDPFATPGKVADAVGGLASVRSLGVVIVLAAVFWVLHAMVDLSLARVDAGIDRLARAIGVSVPLRLVADPPTFEPG